MVKTILKQVKEFKKDSILTPIFMILEVILETLIPLFMAAIIDNGVFSQFNCIIDLFAVKYKKNTKATKI